MRKKTNQETVFQFTILVMTIILLLYGMISGNIYQFVHPRFRFGLWISIFILLLFAISVLSDRKKGRHNINLQKYVIYFIPLIFALAFPPVSTGKADIVLADNITSSKTDYSEELDENLTTADNSDYTDVNDYLNNTQGTQDIKDEKNETDTSQAYDSNKVNGSYVISDETYADWILDIYDHPDAFAGKKYRYAAQVFSMDGLEENQFLAGRYFMVCCAADLVGYGIICENDLRSKLKEDQWINVTGTISVYEYEGAKVPIMKDAVITKAKAPKDEYIYYNNY